MSFSSTAVSYPQANLLLPLNSPTHPCGLFVTAPIAFSSDTSYALTCLLTMFPPQSASSMIVGELSVLFAVASLLPAVVSRP